MDLETLFRLLEFHRGTDRDEVPVKIMTPGGDRYDTLSMSWDSEEGEWVIVGE